MVSSLTYQPMDSVYRNYLMGIANPYQRAYERAVSPFAQLAMMSTPGYMLGQGGEAANPFASFLASDMWGPAVPSVPTGGQATGAAPTGNVFGGSQNWRDRAGAVASALDRYNLGTGTASDIGLGLDFGMGEEGGAANQQRLVDAAVLSNTPLAMRGQTQQILNQLFDRWMGEGQSGNYLQNRQNVWNQFGIT